jgi:hypothetical protein
MFVKAMIPIRALTAEKLELAARKEGMQITVFLAGPFIELAKPPKPLKRNKASRLRYFLFKYLENSNYDVTLGEYRQLLDAYKTNLGSAHNAAVAETGHARNNVDAVVLLPSSPGSFSELGAFSIYKDICEKMLIVIDKQYEGIDNYVNLGPSILAKGYGSTIIYQDYADHIECAKAIDSFITQVKNNKLRDEIMKT